jgi:WD40 repeat protein
LATGSADNTVRVWDVSTEQHVLLAELKGFLKNTLETSGEDGEFTLETSGEDGEFKLETGGEDCKSAPETSDEDNRSTLETGGEDVILHSFRVYFRHESAVFQLAWAHPKFGNLLASCSYDKTVKIYTRNGWKTLKNTLETSGKH